MFPATAAATDPIAIDPAVPLTGIVKPVTGNAPSMVINGGTGYTAKIDRWSDEGTYEITDPFVAGTVYKAHITLTAASGYTFVDYITWSDFIQTRKRPLYIYI